MKLALVYRAKVHVSTIHEIRVFPFWEKCATSHHIFCDGIENAMRGLKWNSHHQNLRLKRSEVNADGKGKARPLLAADVAVSSRRPLPASMADAPAALIEAQAQIQVFATMVSAIMSRAGGSASLLFFVLAPY